MDERRRTHVAIGAVLSFSALPGGSLLGGGLAGYLDGGDQREGGRVGLLAGAVAMVVSLALSLVGTPVAEAADHGVSHFLWIGLGSPALEGIVPFLVWPLVGGWIGSYVRAETGQSD